MHHTTNSNLRTGALSLVLALSLAGSVAAATNAPTDAWITTKVKISLATAEGVSAGDVSVDTINGQVTLHGLVDSAAEKEAAERATREIRGVRNVRNLLQVVPGERKAEVEAKDDEIQSRVTTALQNERSLERSEVSVQSVNKGVVVLKGSTRDLSEQLTAVRVARAVPGVRKVDASQVQTSDAVADTSLWNDDRRGADDRARDDAERAADRAEGTAERAGSDVKEAAGDVADGVKGAAKATADTVRETAGDVGGAARDLYLTSMVKTKLLADESTPAMDINVDTRDGVVSLFGEVPSAESRTAAERAARETSGVKSVRNQLQVVASARPAKDERATGDEAAVEGALQKNLDQYSELDHVNVDVKGCVAHLSGTVESGIERVEALQLARATTGVCSVKDELTIR